MEFIEFFGKVLNTTLFVVGFVVSAVGFVAYVTSGITCFATRGKVSFHEGFAKTLGIKCQLELMCYYLLFPITALVTLIIARTGNEFAFGCTLLVVAFFYLMAMYIRWIFDQGVASVEDKDED